MPRLLASSNSFKGWPFFHRLLVDLFKFMEPCLRNAELGEPVRLSLITCREPNPTLRLTLLSHRRRFASSTRAPWGCSSCCSTISQISCASTTSASATSSPPAVYRCATLFSVPSLQRWGYPIRPPPTWRSVNVPHRVLGASSVSLSPPWRPLTLALSLSLPFMQIDLLAEISQSPRILSDIEGALKVKGLKADVDEYLKVNKWLLLPLPLFGFFFSLGSLFYQLCRRGRKDPPSWQNWRRGCCFPRVTLSRRELSTMCR